jgi:hypothetical protein
MHKTSTDQLARRGTHHVRRDDGVDHVLRVLAQEVGHAHRHVQQRLAQEGHVRDELRHLLVRVLRGAVQLEGLALE